jgi:hypothetical protein
MGLELASRRRLNSQAGGRRYAGFRDSSRDLSNHAADYAPDWKICTLAANVISLTRFFTAEARRECLSVQTSNGYGWRVTGSEAKFQNSTPKNRHELHELTRTGKGREGRKGEAGKNPPIAQMT